MANELNNLEYFDQFKCHIKKSHKISKCIYDRILVYILLILFTHWVREEWLSFWKHVPLCIGMCYIAACIWYLYVGTAHDSKISYISIKLLNTYTITHTRSTLSREMNYTFGVYIWQRWTWDEKYYSYQVTYPINMHKYATSYQLSAASRYEQQVIPYFHITSQKIWTGTHQYHHGEPDQDQISTILSGVAGQNSSFSGAKTTHPASSYGIYIS